MNGFNEQFSFSLSSQKPGRLFVSGKIFESEHAELSHIFSQFDLGPQGETF
jgi:hypothetical protein